jgi:hypothetical protein
LRTILGSCVGITFWSARLGAGALCHGVLPRCPKDWPAGFSLAEGCRYVDFSIRHLARQFDALGACRRDLEVKLFGGRRRAYGCRRPPRQTHRRRPESQGRGRGPGGRMIHRLRVRRGWNSRPEDSLPHRDG